MNYRVVGIGEALWDMLPGGPQLGGAPVNFAYHARQLGAHSSVVTRIGADLPGRKMLERFGEMEIDETTVQVDDHWPTGTTSVILDEAGVPKFTITARVAWDHLEITGEALETVRRADAVCFGTLSQRNPSAGAAIQRLIAAASHSALKIFDINLRQDFYTKAIIEASLRAANVLKLNEFELTAISGMFGLKGGIPGQIEDLMRLFELNAIALTRGENGSLLCREGIWSELPGHPMNVVDTVGAGDAFAAGLVMGFLNQFSLEDAHRIAADLAAFVCSRQGATPVLPRELRAAFLPDCAHA